MSNEIHKGHVLGYCTTDDDIRHGTNQRSRTTNVTEERFADQKRDGINFHKMAELYGNGTHQKCCGSVVEKCTEYSCADIQKSQQIEITSFACNVGTHGNPLKQSRLAEKVDLNHHSKEQTQRTLVTPTDYVFHVHRAHDTRE